MIVMCYTYLDMERGGGLRGNNRTRNRVATCLGSSVSTVKRVWAQYNKLGDAMFDAPVSEPSTRGRKQEYDKDVVAPVIRAFVDSCNV
ncbi:hypothetical protein PF005_g547 [Phytophthora fragariae]|nr:hypothetical protein PF006_g9377 [Phytophthora fragariae]KAE9237674.1 hypothetical protein PF005_g547 [Phytophthora fragariae]KAE9257738.1 hypothetical protein PF002_g749 [Phytophthora fragariae]KAE9329778.1 hypothetical protein PF001_g729 [Phytophthora fragariae]